jgi:class 3 adenylate cyclase
MVATLEVSAKGRPKTVPLVGRTVIGRSQTNDVALPDNPTVSRIHACIERYSSGWVVRDLGASNGTFVNGTRILADHVLRPGDEVRIGNTRLVYEDKDSRDGVGTLHNGQLEHVTVLFTDMVGSTELSFSLDPIAADRVRREHFTLLREAIASSDGTEVKNLGDGLMVGFPGASVALSCAETMQQRVAQNNLATGSSIGLRVGVSCGDATRDENDYFGSPVIEASRLCASAKGGQILAADAVKLTAGECSSHHFGLLGDLQLKGLARPLIVHEVAWGDVGK